MRAYAGSTNSVTRGARGNTKSAPRSRSPSGDSRFQGCGRMRSGRQTIRRRFWLPLAIISRARAAGSRALNQASKDNRERIRAILAVAHEVVQLGARRRIDLVDRVSGLRDIG